MKIKCFTALALAAIMLASPLLGVAAADTGYAFNMRQRMQVIDWIDEELQKLGLTFGLEYHMENVSRPANGGGNILVTIMTHEILSFDLLVADDVVWYDGTTTFSRHNGNHTVRNRRVYGGDGNPNVERKLDVWIEWFAAELFIFN